MLLQSAVSFIPPFPWRCHGLWNFLTDLYPLLLNASIHHQQPQPI